MGATYGTGFGYYKNSNGLSSNPISYARYNGRFQDTQYITDDLAWFKANTTLFDYSVVGIAPILNPADETKLLTTNFWGNLNRATNDLGGSVFDGTDGSTNRYLVDNYTGLGWYLESPILPDTTWEDSIGTIKSLTVVGYSNWRMPAKFDVLNIMTTDGSTNILGDNGSSFTKSIFFLLDSESSTEIVVWNSANQYLDSTTFQLTSPTSPISTINSIICRNHF